MKRRSLTPPCPRHSGKTGPKPVIKSLQVFQAKTIGAKTVDELDQSQQWLGAQARDQFTLQLFALNADTSVEQLLDEHPNLKLKVLYSNRAPSRFRILYGAFKTPEAALTAFQSLPASLTASSGNPVVKIVRGTAGYVASGIPIRGGKLCGSNEFHGHSWSPVW